MNNWDERILNKCEDLTIRVFMRKRTTRQQAQMILRTTESILEHLVITRATENDCKNDKCMQLSIGIYWWKGIARAMSTKISGKHRRVSSESSGESSDHLK